MENSRPAGVDGSCRLQSADSSAGGFAADEPYFLILDKMIKRPYGVAASSYAGDHRIRQPSFLFQHLLFDFFGNHCLKITDDSWERMGAHNRPQTVMGIIHPAGPFPHCLGNRVLQCGGSGFDRNHPGSQQTHFIYIESLAPGIFLAHIDYTFHSHQRRRGSCSHSVLAGPGFRNKSCFPHFLGQKRLAQYIVDLMGAGVVQIFSFQINLCSAQIFCHFFCVIESAGTSAVVLQQIFQLLLKFSVFFVMIVRSFQLDHRVHQSFRNILSSVHPESPSGSCHNYLPPVAFRQNALFLIGF